MKWRTHEGQGSQQNLQQWSRLTQNGQKVESVLWRVEFTVNGGGGGGNDSLVKVRTDMWARPLGISGVNFCPGVRFLAIIDKKV